MISFLAGALSRDRRSLSISAIAHLVRVADHRHNQPLLGPHGHADVVIVLVHEIIAIDLGVDGRDGFERLNAALTKNHMKPSLMPCFLSKGSC